MASLWMVAFPIANLTTPVNISADNEDEIEAILSEREGHSLHEFIDEDEPLWSIIDFDLPREVYDSIEPKLTGKEIQDLLVCAFAKVCKDIFPDWDRKTITIASNSDAKKMSLHISTYGMRLKNIAQVALFTKLIHKKVLVTLQGNSIIDNITNKRSFSLRMLGSPKYNEKTEEHICVKKAIHPKDSRNGGCPIINNVTTDAEFKLVETLLQEANIEGHNLSYPSENFPDKFPLSHVFPSHCLIYDREHVSDNAYIIQNKKSYSFFCYRANQDRQSGFRKPSKKLTISEMALD
ncbi:hypothetical protein C1645_840549 [Glomus cerebriforme]|uniref:Uncharacterized protein n=1 Tax=Glomus cerebriforme TaxID=658196 RepID=A0A397SAZ5_9GLOM|nr:hypothetical protein C1645_840549 [Glomus cerebriforme]